MAKEKLRMHSIEGRVAVGEIMVLLEVGRFDVDGGVEMIMIQVHINVQKHGLEQGRCGKLIG